MSTPYKRPITATAFLWIGAAAFLAGIVAAITEFVDVSGGHSSSAGTVSGVCFIIGALYMGAGNVIDYLNRSSLRSDRIEALLTNEFLPQLKALDARLASRPSTEPNAPEKKKS